MTRILEAGVLPVYKPLGPSSRKMVDRVVRVLGIRRAGHAGTLDPAAEGLLLVAWGKATGMVQYLQEYPKVYRATIRLGVSTDTQDATGTVIEEKNPDAITREALVEGMSRFRGTILQTPPIFSALKHEGRRLYRLAREGKQVTIDSRPREVKRFELLEWAPPLVTVDVECSKGTYIRTLAHDLGQELGCGAHLANLVRTRVGHFDIEDAVNGDELDILTEPELKRRSVSPEDCLPDWPAITVEGDEARSVVYGSWRDPNRTATESRGYRVLNPGGELLALASGGEAPRLLRVFAERH